MTRARLSGGAPDVRAMTAGTEAEIARASTLTVRDSATNLKEAWRDQIVGAQLGQRLARTVRMQVYPSGQDSVDAAAVVWTKAPKIIESYAYGATIRPVSGARYLWIPTDEVPKKRQGNRLTPAEVEARFGRDLVVVDPGHPFKTRSTTLTGSGVAFAGFRGLSVRRASGRWRNATRNEMTPGHRSYRSTTTQFVVMFTLVPAVRKDVRLDLPALAREVEGAWSSLLTKNWSAS